MKTVRASVVGSSFHHGAGALLQRLRPGNPLRIVRQPDNKYDKNAVAIFWSGTPLGYIPRGLATEIAPLLDAGVEINARASETAYVIELSYEEPDATNPAS